MQESKCIYKLFTLKLCSLKHYRTHLLGWSHDFMSNFALQPIKDWVLYLIIGVFVGIDVIVLSIVTVWRMTLQSRLLQREVRLSFSIVTIGLVLIAMVYNYSNAKI